MNGESFHIKDNNLQKLRELFPDVFSEGSLDWEKLKAAFSNDINFANERYVLNWHNNIADVSSPPEYANTTLLIDLFIDSFIH